MLKAFARFQRRERLADASLRRSIALAEQGLIDADLGGCLIRQRIPRAGAGKSGGYRTIIAYRRGVRAVFLLGFAKSERDNLGDDELGVLRARGRTFLELSRQQMGELLRAGDVVEIDDDDQV